MITAENLLIVAISHSKSAQVLYANAPERAFQGVNSPSIFLLMGYSLELSLKAAFLKLGGDPRALISAIGHDLQVALEHAAAVGFQPTSYKLALLVEALAESHKAHSFRYLERERMILPEVEPSLQTLDAHCTQVGHLVWADDPRLQGWGPR